MKFSITKSQYNALFLCQTKNDVRYYLAGTHINVDKSRLESTNGHAMVTVSVTFFERHSDDTNVIVKLPKKAPAKARTVFIADGLARFHDKNGEMFESVPLEIIEANFVDCERVLIKPEQQTTPTEHFGVNPKLFAPICSEFAGLIFGFKFYDQKMVCDLDDKTKLTVMLTRI